MELTSIYLEAKGWTKRVACLLRLHEIFTQAVKQTDYLKKKLIKIKTEKQLAKGSSQELFEHCNMQSFILRGAADTFDFFVASGIWKMPLLRNFCIQGIGSLGTSSIVHRNLESISWLDSMLCTKDLFTRIPNLKKLGIYGGYDKNNLDCFYNFVHLRQLEELSIRSWWNLNHIPCSGIQWATSFLPKLKKLKFFDTKLQWSDMRLFGMLPNLQVLKLINSIASEDKMWEPSEEGFRQLKKLVIEDVFFERWNAVGDNFSVLECLELRNCYSLQEIPSGFANITTLVLIQLKSCLDSDLASAKLIQEEQYNNYGNAVLVCSENIRLVEIKSQPEYGVKATHFNKSQHQPLAQEAGTKKCLKRKEPDYYSDECWVRRFIDPGDENIKEGENDCEDIVRYAGPVVYPKPFMPANEFYWLLGVDSRDLNGEAFAQNVIIQGETKAKVKSANSKHKARTYHCKEEFTINGEAMIVNRKEHVPAKISHRLSLRDRVF
nr:putative late blight resistance protein homolog R1A-4 [Ipomoea trifida]